MWKTLWDVRIWKLRQKAKLEVELNTPGMVGLWRPWVLCSSCEQGISS